MRFVIKHYKEFFDKIKEPLRKKWGYEKDESNLVIEIFYLNEQIKRIKRITEDLLDGVPKNAFNISKYGYLLLGFITGLLSVFIIFNLL